MHQYFRRCKMTKMWPLLTNFFIQLILSFILFYRRSNAINVIFEYIYIESIVIYSVTFNRLVPDIH